MSKFTHVTYNYMYVCALGTLSCTRSNRVHTRTKNIHSVTNIFITYTITIVKFTMRTRGRGGGGSHIGNTLISELFSACDSARYNSFTVVVYDYRLRRMKSVSNLN